jgi:hypothetical protein
MHRFAHVFISVLLLAAAALSAGCGGGVASDGSFSPDLFWKKQQREGN